MDRARVYTGGMMRGRDGDSWPDGPLPLVSVSGEPYQMGRQHGIACRELIRRTLEARVAIAARATAASSAQLVQAGLRYLEPVRARFPHLVDEVRGIADGAGIDFAEAFFIQVATEVSFPADGCTTLAVRGLGGHWLIAQNWDVPRDTFGSHIILRLQPTGRPAVVMFTFAGVVGYLGINECGVCHVANQLRTPDWCMGVTHYFIKRHFLELGSVDACLAAVHGIPISSAATYILGDPARAVVVEWMPSGTAMFAGDRLGHTNHIVDPALRHLERYLPALPDSVDRLARVGELLHDTDGSLAGMQAMLSDHVGHPASICRHGGAGDLHTLASVIFEPSRRRMHVAYGTPCATPYWTYALDGTVHPASVGRSAAR